MCLVTSVRLAADMRIDLAQWVEDTGTPMRLRDAHELILVGVACCVALGALSTASEASLLAKGAAPAADGATHTRGMLFALAAPSAAYLVAATAVAAARGQRKLQYTAEH